MPRGSRAGGRGERDCQARGVQAGWIRHQAAAASGSSPPAAASVRLARAGGTRRGSTSIAVGLPFFHLERGSCLLLPSSEPRPQPAHCTTGVVRQTGMGSGGGEAIAAAAAFEPQETPLQPLQQQPAAPPPPQQQQQHLLLQAEELEALDATTLELPLPDTMVLAPAEVRWRRRRLRTMVTELSNPVRVPGPPATIPSAAGWDHARVKPPRPAVVLKQKRPRIRGFDASIEC